MPRNLEPKYYAIDNWRQACNAVSNVDPTLKIRYTEFVNNACLEGGRIQVVHPEFGVVFACFTQASGTLVNYDPNAFLDTPSILLALRQLGFDIRFKINPTINSATKQYLQAAWNMGYTSVRWAVKQYPRKTDATVYGDKYIHKQIVRAHTRVIICFDENKRPEYMNQFIPPIKNFGGDVMVVDLAKNPQLDFTWLYVPMNIQSVLQEG